MGQERTTGNKAAKYQERPQEQSGHAKQSRPQSQPRPQSQQPQLKMHPNKPHVALEMDESPAGFSNRSYGTSGISREAIRKGFIRKVLVILALELAFSAVAIGVTYIEGSGIRDFLINNRGILWAAVCVAFVTLIILVCKRDAVSKVPMNYILLALFNIAIAYILANIAAYTESDVVVFAGGFTVAIVIAVALYAIFTKTDLSRKGFFVSGLVMIALMVLLFCLCFRSRFLNIIYSGIIGLLYVFFLAYDIQRLIGTYETQYSMDEYIIASLDLYVDIIKIFLVLLMARKSSD